MKKDILFALIMGFLTGLFLIPTLSNNNVQIPYGNMLLIFGLPALSAIGIVIAKKIGQYIRVIFQIAKFGLTGVFNASIDFGILNLLIAATGISGGISYTLFKSISFIAANLNSFFWNKKWTFEETAAGEGHNYVKFLTVSLGGLLINVGAASIVVNFLNPSFGLDLKQWANVGAAVGSIAGLAWNFLGYKFVVFATKK